MNGARSGSAELQSEPPQGGRSTLWWPRQKQQSHNNPVGGKTPQAPDQAGLLPSAPIATCVDNVSQHARAQNSVQKSRLFFGFNLPTEAWIIATSLIVSVHITII